MSTRRKRRTRGSKHRRRKTCIRRRTGTVRRRRQRGGVLDRKGRQQQVDAASAQLEADGLAEQARIGERLHEEYRELRTKLTALYARAQEVRGNEVETEAIIGRMRPIVRRVRAIEQEIQDILNAAAAHDPSSMPSWAPAPPAAGVRARTALGARLRTGLAVGAGRATRWGRGIGTRLRTRFRRGRVNDNFPVPRPLDHVDKDTLPGTALTPAPRLLD